MCMWGKKKREKKEKESRELSLLRLNEQLNKDSEIYFFSFLAKMLCPFTDMDMDLCLSQIHSTSILANRSHYSDILQECIWKCWFLQILRLKHTNHRVENCGTSMCYKKSRILCDSHYCHQFYICGSLSCMSVFNTTIKQQTHMKIHRNKAEVSGRKAEVGAGGRGSWALSFRFTSC